FGDAVLDGLAYQRMIRDFTIPGDVLETGRRVGERCGEQVVRLHSLELWRHLLAATVARNREGDGCVPAPARAEHRGLQKGLDQDVANRVRMEEFEDVLERERVLWAKREQEAIFGGRGLQLEVELTTEPLPQRQSPGAIDPAPERRMNDELHAARFIEEPL